jgi:hypothetical protein
VPRDASVALGDGSAPPLPLRHSPKRRARFLAAKATKVENLRSIVRRHVQGASDSPDEDTDSELAYAVGDLTEWYFWPR